MPTTGQISSASTDAEKGGFVGLKRDAKGEACGAFLLRLRGLIADEMARQGVSRAELARRLGVRPSVVTRVMNPDADLFASTLFDLAWALDRTWETRLIPRRGVAGGNHAPVTLNVASVPQRAEPRQGVVGPQQGMTVGPIAVAA